MVLAGIGYDCLFAQGMGGRGGSVSVSGLLAGERVQNHGMPIVSV